MNREGYRKEITRYRPYLSDDYNYPNFKVGEEVWAVDDYGENNQFKNENDSRFKVGKKIIVNGPLEDDCDWFYMLCDINEDDSCYISQPTENKEQSRLFRTLKEAKVSVKFIIDRELEILNEHISNVEKQYKHIDILVDEKEHRDEQINSVIDE